jgi:hypothetical protein
MVAPLEAVLRAPVSVDGFRDRSGERPASSRSSGDTPNDRVAER